MRRLARLILNLNDYKMEKKQILICGAGSIGVYLGAKLYSKGHDVKLFGRRKLREVQEKTIIDGKEFKVPEKVFRVPGNEKHDFIFITTKLYDFDKMVELIRKNKIKGKIVASVQNGLVDTSKSSRILGKRIVPVTVFSGFNLKDGKIETSPTPIGWRTELSREGKEVEKLLSSADVNCRADRNYDSLRAEKTIVNCCLNALSAIENKPFCDLFKNKRTMGRIEKVFKECYSILSRDYSLEKEETMMKNMVKNWSKLRHFSSTCQDVRSGRKNEAKFFNGYVAKLGKTYNLQAEENKKILEEIKEVGSGR